MELVKEVLHEPCCLALVRDWKNSCCNHLLRWHYAALQHPHHISYKEHQFCSSRRRRSFHLKAREMEIHQSHLQCQNFKEPNHLSEGKVLHVVVFLSFVQNFVYHYYFCFSFLCVDPRCVCNCVLSPRLHHWQWQLMASTEFLTLWVSWC